MPNKFTSDQDEILVMLYMYKKFTNRFFVDKQIQDWLYDNYDGYTIGVPDCLIFNNYGKLTDQYWDCRMIQVCRSYNMKHLEKMIIEKLTKSLTFLINMKDLGKTINFTTLKFDIVIWIQTKLYNDAFDFIDIINIKLYSIKIPFVIKIATLSKDIEPRMFDHQPTEYDLFKGNETYRFDDVIDSILGLWNVAIDSKYESISTDYYDIGKIFN